MDGAVIGNYAVIGGMPEHREFFDDVDLESCAGVFIGENVRVFEFATIQSGTKLKTRVMNGAAIFNHAHVAHDCVVGIGALVGGGASLAGHTVVMRGANVSGKSCTVQWCVIGAYAFLGGFTFANRHIPTAEKWLGFPARKAGMNDIGLSRAGLTIDDLDKQGLIEHFNHLSETRSLCRFKSSLKTS